MSRDQYKTVSLRRFVIEYLANHGDGARRTRAAARLICRMDASRGDFLAAAESFKGSAHIAALHLLAMANPHADRMAAEVLAMDVDDPVDEWIDYWSPILQLTIEP